MARRPNYGAERRERDRRKSEKRRKRQEVKDERARLRKGEDGEVGEGGEALTPFEGVANEENGEEEPAHTPPQQIVE